MWCCDIRFLFIPKAGAAATSKFDGGFLFLFFKFFLFFSFYFSLSPKTLSSRLMGPQQGAKTAESTRIRCQCIPLRYPARTELTKQGFSPLSGNTLCWFPAHSWLPVCFLIKMLSQINHDFCLLGLFSVFFFFKEKFGPIRLKKMSKFWRIIYSPINMSYFPIM